VAVAAGVVLLGRPARRAPPADPSSAAPAAAALPPPTPHQPVPDTARPSAAPPARAAPTPRREPPAARRLPTESTVLESLREEAAGARRRAMAAGGVVGGGDSVLAVAESLARAGRTVQAAARFSTAAALWNEEAERPSPVAAPEPSPAPAPAPAPPARAAADSAARFVGPPPPAPAPAEPVPARRAPPAEPAQEIGRLIDAYTGAIEARSLPAIRKVYPGIQPAQVRDWQQFFEAVSAIDVELKITRLDVAGAAAEAGLAGVYVFIDPSSRRERREDVSLVARLKRDPSGWRIESLR